MGYPFKMVDDTEGVQRRWMIYVQRPNDSCYVREETYFDKATAEHMFEENRKQGIPVRLVEETVSFKLLAMTKSWQRVLKSEG